MSSKKRKYRERIASSGGGVLDLFDHPDFRGTQPPPTATREDGDDEPSADADVDDRDLIDAPAAEPRPRILGGRDALARTIGPPLDSGCPGCAR